MNSPILRLEGIHKSFGPVHALKGVSMEVYPGRVHALIGENGAGKSTLMKILSGALQSDQGKMNLAGKAYRPFTPFEGRAAGVSMIYQELNLAPHLSIEENISLGIEQHAWGWIKPLQSRIANILTELGQSSLSPETLIQDLSIGKQQLVEIGRALIQEAKIVVMDEPTSSLSAKDTQALFQVIKKLTEKGVAVIYISHFLEEIKEIAHDFTVLRDGETVASGIVESVGIPELIRHMVGREVNELYPKADHSVGAVLLEAKDLQGFSAFPVHAAFDLRKGEILGIAGLVGSGRSETVRMLFGLEHAQKGSIHLKGGKSLKVKYLSPNKALQNGINLLSEDRKEEGLALNLSLLENLTLPALKRYQFRGFLRLKQEYLQGDHWLKELKVKYHDPLQRADSLSGGNQQKVCLARLLHADSDILILDEPTRGIDIGSKSEIYKLIHTLAAEERALIVVSSYLPELFGICDSLAVMYKGSLSEKKPIHEWSDEAVMLYATSGITS